MSTYPPIVQFPDLTEIEYIGLPYGVSKEVLDTIKTEFIFYVKALGTSKQAEEWGFKPVSCMNNWYSAHRQEWRRMTLYWMRNPNYVEEPLVATRVSWGINRYRDIRGVHAPYIINRTELTEDSFLASSGCGFQIGEPPFVSRLFHRFHTLMRMPVDVTSLKEKWLKRHNYRLLDIGKLASYWVNGWDPKEYSPEKEREYFKVNILWKSLPKKGDSLFQGNTKEEG